MNREQAFTLARQQAASLAAELGGDFTVVEIDGDGPTRFWVTDNPEQTDEDFDSDEVAYFTLVNSHTNDGVFIVERNNRDGGGVVWIDEQTCFETSF